MHKLIVVLLLFYPVINVASQIERKANAVLIKRNFALFNEFVTKYQLEKDSVQISCDYIRELVAGYEESVFHIFKAYPINKGVSITCTPRINLIAKGNKIIYFSLQSKRFIDFPNSLTTISDTTYQFMDSVKYQDLKIKFQQIFLAPLH